MFENRVEAPHGDTVLKTYQKPHLVKLFTDETASGLVILPIEIEGVQGPNAS